MTLSLDHPSGSPATVEVDYIRVVEESSIFGVSPMGQQVVAGAAEEYSVSRGALTLDEGKLWPRTTPCPAGDTRTPISASSVSFGVLRVDLNMMPTTRAHWWTGRGTMNPPNSPPGAKRYFVEARFRVNGAAAIQFGLDYWRTLSAPYINDFDPNCSTRVNNCEAFVSSWIGDTKGEFITRQFPTRN
jgi:hypothetical protein